LGLSRRRLALIFVLCCIHWLLRYSVLYLVIEGLGHDVAWAWTFLVQMLSMAAGQASMLPGGLGGAELTSTALLTPLIGLSQASVAVLIWRFVTFHFYLLAGAPVFACLFHRQFLSRRRPSLHR
ncbi:YbhN family protein, partial [Halomonas sp. BBD48]|nr:YbhN family protein [Halomonas sp. BBD48]